MYQKSLTIEQVQNLQNQIKLAQQEDQMFNHMMHNYSMNVAASSQGSYIQTP